jgi:regulator of protease activity HflC (stomatin/prohibitin superfamily)
MGIHPVTVGVAVVIAAVLGWVGVKLGNAPLGGLGILLAWFVLYSARVAKQWQKSVILRMGRFHCLKGPGLFFVIPLADTIPYWIDLRTITTPFTAEETLTKDSVPVDVDAVLFWRVVEPMKAALEVENYKQAISWASQTALRDVIGESELATMLVGRQQIDAKLCRMIDERTERWGIKALSVEIRDVKIPVALQNAMSMQAQAERERQARVILGESEVQVANKFKEASNSYLESPIALHLRAMNILLEGMRQNSTIVIVPSSAVETMGLGAMTGIASLAKEFAKENAKKEG